ncbi:hypothetical protein L873DRAFT_1790475 [Choiromyces venosus 120613-1]|uniref:Uncharacterized protein n=1 Tax=Choiromyces venosus 120613-1 TaxID=1336337 RepID=A0A3N4JMA8_9PEZI|nr:hypothetical protein L873DRAFT_1790475 [Choiromyces venosus 120613-1]
MYITQDFYIETPLSQPYFAKRDNLGSNEQETSGTHPGEIVAIIIAALTLLVAMAPLFRSSRLRRWGSSFLASSFVKKAFSTIRPNSAPTTIAAMEDLSTTPVADIPRPGPVFIYNDYSNASFAGTRSNTSPHGLNNIPGEDGGVPRAVESLEPRRPEPAVTWPLR